jgi:cellulose synthase/poly-beta-1,6-N-acetylglucosamine synthase-like glycosyltransferase
MKEKLNFTVSGLIFNLMQMFLNIILAFKGIITLKEAIFIIQFILFLTLFLYLLYNLYKLIKFVNLTQKHITFLNIHYQNTIKDLQPTKEKLKKTFTKDELIKLGYSEFDI